MTAVEFFATIFAYAVMLLIGLAIAHWKEKKK